MSEDIKVMFDNIQKETDTVKKEELLKQYQTKLNELSEDSTRYKEVQSKGIFKELEETRKKLQEIEDNKKKQEEADALEKGKFKELAEARQKELDTLNTKLTEAEAKAKEWELYQDTKRKDLLSKIEDEDLKKVGEEIKGLDKLEIFANKITQKEPFKTDNGQASGTQVTLTDQQKAEAKRMGVSEKDFIEIMEFRNKNKKT